MAKIYYARLPEDWTRQQKYAFLEAKQHIYNIDWQEFTPDAKHNWLTEGMCDEFATFLPLGTKEAKAAKDSEVETIFKTYSNGVKTNRDVWVYNFDYKTLVVNINRFTDFYNEQVYKWIHSDKQKTIDEFVTYDTKKIAWSDTLKSNLKAGNVTAFDESKMRTSLYRPFTKQCLYFDRKLNERVYGFPSIFPTTASEAENQIICVNGIGADSYTVYAAQKIVDVKCGMIGNSTIQCFPFYIYNEDGTKKRENITDWALQKFRENYKDSSITKRSIFNYIYAILNTNTY